MTDPQLHRARWVPIESVVAFWDIFITPLFIVRGKEEIFFLIITHIKNKSKQLKDFISIILHVHVPQLHLNCLTPQYIVTVR